MRKKSFSCSSLQFFLAYVLPENVSKEVLIEYIDYHRQIVEDQAKIKISASEWRKRFLFALYDYLLQRLSLLILIEKLEPRNVAKLYRPVMRMIAILSEETRLLYGSPHSRG